MEYSVLFLFLLQVQICTVNIIVQLFRLCQIQVSWPLAHCPGQAFCQETADSLQTLKLMNYFSLLLCSFSLLYPSLSITKQVKWVLYVGSCWSTFLWEVEGWGCRDENCSYRSFQPAKGIQHSASSHSLLCNLVLKIVGGGNFAAGKRSCWVLVVELLPAKEASEEWDIPEMAMCFGAPVNGLASCWHICDKSLMST